MKTKLDFKHVNLTILNIISDVQALYRSLLSYSISLSPPTPVTLLISPATCISFDISFIKSNNRRIVCYFKKTCKQKCISYVNILIKRHKIFFSLRQNPLQLINAHCQIIKVK
jgi:hypothetical protein